MKEVFIHIGYPKCFSTTIQRSYFEKNPLINFQGVGVGDNVSYSLKSIELVFESFLKYSNNLFYKSKLDSVRNQLSELITNSTLPVVFSSEYLSMKTFPNEIEAVLKYQRLLEIFKDFKINILVIKRNPRSLLRSFYKEYLRLGFDKDYDYFLKHIYLHRDRSFLLELNFQNKLNELSHFFKDGVKVLNYEDIIIDPSLILNEELAQWLNIPLISLPFNNDNPSIPDNLINSFVKLNKDNPRGLSLEMYLPFEKHRNRVVYSLSEIEEISDDNIYSDVVLKRKSLNDLNGLPKMEFLFNRELEDKVILFLQNS